MLFAKDENNIWCIQDKITNERFVKMFAKVIGDTIELDTTITQRSDSVMVE
jgi:hypothetical protein